MPGKKKSQHPDLGISDVAKQASVSKQTIEYYIMLGLVRPKSDPKTRRRTFDASHVKRVKLISELNRTGYTLREIREIWIKRR